MDGRGQRVDPTLVGDDESIGACVPSRGAELDTHSFIIKIWLEERADESGRALWRGHITQYQRRTTSVAVTWTFVGRYLEQMGVRLGALSRLWRCLRRPRAAQRRKRRRTRDDRTDSTKIE
jgi:hypothetical protein